VRLNCARPYYFHDWLSPWKAIQERDTEDAKRYDHARAEWDSGPRSQRGVSSENAEESKRRRQGREVRDAVQRELAAIALDLQSRRLDASLPSRTRSLLHGAGTRLLRLSRDMAVLSEDLHPLNGPALDE
jgi:hypothetical protein